MHLLNTPTPFPAVMWTVVRFLVSSGKPTTKDAVTMFLEPGEEARNSGPVHHSLNSLRDLGLAVVSSEGEWSLAGGLENISVDDLSRFQRVIRRAVLAVDAEVPDPPEDVRRGLTWILTRDPFKESFNAAIFDALHNGSAPDGHLVLANTTRWAPFAAWGTFLGLMATAPHPADRYTPDCTQAVRQTLSASLELGRPVESMSALQLLRREIPVLMGGSLAEAQGYTPSPAKTAGPAVSFALMRGEHEGWLALGQDSDASTVINLHDPERTSPRSCSTITLLEGDDA
ncbi:protein DpdG [Streptomyces sp. NPDC058664]|uniref:protein DpdG n=1 Tax=unclassified Streptomyces TaxID=2593676 RepID=UPI00365533C3